MLDRNISQRSFVYLLRGVVTVPCLATTSGSLAAAQPLRNLQQIWTRERPGEASTDQRREHRLTRGTSDTRDRTQSWLDKQSAYAQQKLRWQSPPRQNSPRGAAGLFTVRGGRRRERLHAKLAQEERAAQGITGAASAESTDAGAEVVQSEAQQDSTVPEAASTPESLASEHEQVSGLKNSSEKQVSSMLASSGKPAVITADRPADDSGTLPASAAPTSTDANTVAAHTPQADNPAAAALWTGDAQGAVKDGSAAVVVPQISAAQHTGPYKSAQADVGGAAVGEAWDVPWPLTSEPHTLHEEAGELAQCSYLLSGLSCTLCAVTLLRHRAELMHVRIARADAYLVACFVQMRPPHMREIALLAHAAASQSRPPSASTSPLGAPPTLSPRPL